MSSWFEHSKAAKDMSQYLPYDHPKLLAVREEANKISELLNGTNTKTN